MALKIVPLPYQTVTEQRLRLIIEYLRIEPEGVPRQELTELVGLPEGSSTMTYRLLQQAGLIIIQTLPHGSRVRQFITPTEKLLEQSTEESLDQALDRTPPQPPALSPESPDPSSPAPKSPAPTSPSSQAAPRSPRDLFREALGILRRHPDGIASTHLADLLGVSRLRTHHLFKLIRADMVEIQRRGNVNFLRPTYRLMVQSDGENLWQTMLAPNYVNADSWDVEYEAPPVVEASSSAPVEAPSVPKDDPHDPPTERPVGEVKEDERVRVALPPEPPVPLANPTDEEPARGMDPSLPEKLSPTLSTPLQKIVVTRHQAIVDYMKEIGLIDDTTPVYPHARDTMVEGKHVFGVLPLHLAARAARLTTIPLLGIPHHLRGRDLTLDEVRRYAGPPTTYEVRQVGVEF